MPNFSILSEDELKKIAEELAKKYSIEYKRHRVSGRGNLMVNGTLVFDKSLNLIANLQGDLRLTDFFGKNKIHFIEHANKVLKGNVNKIELIGKSIIVYRNELNFKIETNILSSNPENILALFELSLKKALEEKANLNNQMIIDTFVRKFENNFYHIFNNAVKEEETSLKYQFSTLGNYTAIFLGETYESKIQYRIPFNEIGIPKYDELGYITEIVPKITEEDFLRLHKDNLLKIFKDTTFEHFFKVKNEDALKYFPDLRNNYYYGFVLGAKPKSNDIKVLSSKISEKSFNKKVKNNFFEYNIETKELKIIDDRFLILKEHEEIVKRLNTFVCQTFKNEKFEIIAIGGKGLLFGNLKVNIISKENKTVNFSTEMSTLTFDYKNEKEWKMSVEKEFKNLLLKYEDELNKVKEIYYSKIKNFKNDFIYYDILKFIEKNEDYITFNAMQDTLRGKKAAFSGAIEKTENCGKYGYFTKEDIEKAFNKLLKEDFIYLYCYSGKYGDYNLLKLDGPINVESFKNSTYKKDFKITNINNKIKEENKLYDYEALFLFEKLKEKDDLKSYIKSLNCLTLGFICLYGEEYKAYTKNAPSEFKKLIELKKKTETDKAKIKFYNELIKNFKEK